MKIAAHIAASLLGFVFVAFSLMFLLNLMGKMPVPTPDSAEDHFMKAFIPTGYMTFVKIFELVGGVLILIPKTRNLGLLVLSPIILNILAYHVLVHGGDLPMPIILGALALFLLIFERQSFAALIH